jgi:uncharacterized protein with PQ loop repeat
MMEWILSRATIVTLAVLGGIFAGLASLLQARGSTFAPRTRQLTIAGYVFMAASMVLFVVAGFLRGRF